MNAYRGSRGIAPVISDLGTNWRWVVNMMLWLLYYGERTCYTLS